MCRESITPQNRTKEHIIPKWILRRFNLFNAKFQLINGDVINYNSFTVPCCLECNGSAMSSWEKLITDSFDKGFEYFKKIPSSILAWWLYKMFYCNLVTEYGMKANKADINSKHLISKENMRKYEKFYFLHVLAFKRI